MVSNNIVRFKDADKFFLNMNETMEDFLSNMLLGYFEGFSYDQIEELCSSEALLTFGEGYGEYLQEIHDILFSNINSRDLDQVKFAFLDMSVADPSVKINIFVISPDAICVTLEAFYAHNPVTIPRHRPTVNWGELPVIQARACILGKGIT